MDRIIIEDLLLRCIVGVNPEERIQEQDVNLRITLSTDLRQAGSSDVLADTVDYSTLQGDICVLACPKDVTVSDSPTGWDSLDHDNL